MWKTTAFVLRVSLSSHGGPFPPVSIEPKTFDTSSPSMDGGLICSPPQLECKTSPDQHAQLHPFRLLHGKHVDQRMSKGALTPSNTWWCWRCFLHVFSSTSLSIAVYVPCSLSPWRWHSARDLDAELGGFRTSGAFWWFTRDHGVSVDTHENKHLLTGVFHSFGVFHWFSARNMRKDMGKQTPVDPPKGHETF